MKTRIPGEGTYPEAIILFITIENAPFARLNKKVGFKLPTTRSRKNSILCGAIHIGTAKWTSGVRWSFGASRVARGIKGS